MQAEIVCLGRLFVGSLLCAGAALAGPAQFDFKCQGTMRETTLDGSSSRSFMTLFNIDLDKNAFCNEEYCGNLSGKNRNILRYHCITEIDSPCNPVPYWAIGPVFIRSEDFVIDRTNGSFHRTSSGYVGNALPIPFNASFSGSCIVSTFTGLASDGKR